MTRLMFFDRQRSILGQAMIINLSRNLTTVQNIFTVVVSNSFGKANMTFRVILLDHGNQGNAIFIVIFCCLYVIKGRLNQYEIRLMGVFFVRQNALFVTLGQKLMNGTATGQVFRQFFSLTRKHCNILKDLIACKWVISQFCILRNVCHFLWNNPPLKTIRYRVKKYFNTHGLSF